MLKCILSILLVSALSLNTFSFDLPDLKFKSKKSFDFTDNNKLNLSLSENNLKVSLLTGTSAIKKDTIKANRQKKSVAIGVIMSALIPGAGQLYAKKYLKAAIFIGAEALSWATFFYFNKKGDNQTDFFQNYANNNWSIHRYGQWLKDNFTQASGIDPNQQDLNILRNQIIAAEQEIGFSHSMPELYSQQYYELIGKYQNFLGGWADADTINSINYHYAHTPMFDYYAKERQKANDFYDYSKIGSFAAIINHILSAADAAWSVISFNRDVEIHSSIRVYPEENKYTGNFMLSPKLNVKITF